MGAEQPQSSHLQFLRATQLLKPRITINNRIYLVVVTWDNTFVSIEAASNVNPRLWGAHTEVSQMPHTILWFNCGVPALYHCSITLISISKFGPNSRYAI